MRKRRNHLQIVRAAAAAINERRCESKEEGDANGRIIKEERALTKEGVEKYTI